MAVFDEQTQQLSKYNDGMFSISRLHEIWLKAKHYKDSGNLNGWKSQLEDAWLELYTDVKRHKDKKKLIKTNLIFMKRVAESKNRKELFFVLFSWQQFLRGIQDLAGKAGVYTDEHDDLDQF